MNFTSYSLLEIINENNKVKPIQKNVHNLLILANITTYPFSDILKFYFSKFGGSCNIINGKYNNIVQDSKGVKNDSAIIFFELSQLSDGFPINSSTMGSNEIEIIEDRVKVEIDVLLTNLTQSKVIIFNKFTSIHYAKCSSSYIELVKNLNVYISKCKSNYPNLKVIDLNHIFRNIGKIKAVDSRGLYNQKIMYSFDFYKYYIQYIASIYLPLLGVYKKVLVMDCDNTLWRGIISEDGMNGIDMSSSGIGFLFRQIQYIVSSLAKKGIILCLCSKNNLMEVDNVINNHPDFLIKNDDITLKMVNWTDKSQNILSISEQLNVGLDSILYVDDSEFEIGLIKQQLPEVECMLVPANIYSYPEEFLDFTNMFFNYPETIEDIKRVERNEENTRRIIYKEKFFSLEDYLLSLKIELNIQLNEDNDSLRLSQLSLKTNQFNLTTKRYSEPDIKKLMVDLNCDVLSISANDIFGSSGIVSLLILKYEDQYTASIDSFMLSCRVLGRNIEFAIIYFLFDYLKNKNIKLLDAQYSKTVKNSQVKSFYHDCGFDILIEDKNFTSYNINLIKVPKNMLNYINVSFK